MYIDVHTHLTHEKFNQDLEQVITRAEAAGVLSLVVNGLEPNSNRLILQLAKQHNSIIPALGIYPIDAVNGLVKDLPFPVATFDVDKELDFIESQVKLGHVKAIGECGLDGYWVKENTFSEQERVFERLIQISLSADIPIIVHTRKLEKRSIEILAHHNVKKVNFHCYGGKVKLAIRSAEEFGWYFSIPANARKNQAFTKMLLELPESSILTETDAPFLSPTQGERNEPKNVVETVKYLAELKGWKTETAKELIWKNFQRLFSLV